MTVTLKSASQFGFESSYPIHDAKPNRMYLLDKENLKIWLIDNIADKFYSAELTPNKIGLFESKANWAIIPPDCCNAAGGKEIPINWELLIDGKG